MISYTITVCNEDLELDILLRMLSGSIRVDDEIVLQMDSMTTTSAVRAVIDSYRIRIPNLKVVEYPLDRNFAKFKNNLKSHCTKPWIFNIDADETPSLSLINNLHYILEANPNIDIISVPRWNTVEGITDEHIINWNWHVDSEGRINWPDYQNRIYQNKDNIIWVNRVHERLSGHESESYLPSEEEYCLYHPKTIQRQKKQNDFYQNIIKGQK
jgi:hypothetical protein